MINLLVVNNLLETCMVCNQHNLELLEPFHSFNYYETLGRFRPTIETTNGYQICSCAFINQYLNGVNNNLLKINICLGLSCFWALSVDSYPINNTRLANCTCLHPQAKEWRDTYIAEFDKKIFSQSLATGPDREIFIIFALRES